MEVPVLVVGAGPVGLVAALELQSRGIRTLLIERNATTTRHPKMDVTNGRSMEHFRRLGLAEGIRDAAVPRGNCMDVSWVSRLGEWELTRFHYPNVHEARRHIRNKNDGSQPLEPYMRMSQIVLEPHLRDVLAQSSSVEIRYGWELVEFVQDAAHVTATIRDEAGTVETVRCELLAGCDGGRSRVREQLGAVCEGSWNVFRPFMIHFRTPARELLRRFGIAWHYQSPVGGTLIAQDDDEIYTLHTGLPPGADESGIDIRELLFTSLGLRFPCDILQANAWAPHLVVANVFGKGRVWMAGDAVHQFMPTGGYGMNTGVGDAVDLAWKFAAFLNGWGGVGLLESIEAERRPVAVENCAAASRHLRVRLEIAAAYDAAIHEDTVAGAAARDRSGSLIAGLGNAENESLGIEIGYRYRASPVISRENDEPEWLPLEYVPSTWPGVRAPHVFLDDGTAIFDRFGRWFTLLRFADIDVTRFTGAAAQRGVPLDVVDIREANARRIYERDLVLVRPDQHVAWRGDVPPEEPLAVMDLIRGGA